jgi:uncharacterized protein (DUF4213/DUF364 family)
MAIVDEIYNRLNVLLQGRTVAEVRMGLGYTAVGLDNGRCGIAYTYREEAHEGCSAVREAGTLAGRPASELASWVKRPDAVAGAVGLATLNALIDPPADATDSDLLDLLEIHSDEAVGMVGYFGPWVEVLRGRVRALHIFERRPQRQPEVLPDWAASTLLPECHAVIISGTTIINRTLDGLLAHCGNAREIAISGPSTPLVPEVFRLRGVTLLGGVQVVNPERLFQIVSEGGGTRHFGTAVRKLAVRLKP